jgi:SAM-dependent methyltransferase
MLSLDVICLPAEGFCDRWILYNVFTRTCLGVDARAFSWLASSVTVAEGEIPIWLVGWFSHAEGTMADPTRIRRSPAEWGEPKMVSYSGFLEICRKSWLLLEDDEVYQKRFARKSTPLDAQHFGNFHDQLGFHLLVERRISPSVWWLEQKFSSDLKSVRSDNLYGQVQEPFLRNYFGCRVRKAMRALDLGCGIGFFSNLMAEAGCTVLGIDPNKEYIQLAQKNAHPGASFEVRSIGLPGDLDALSNESFDLIFIQDALLFYFIKVSGNDTQELDVLLNDVHRLLKPEGSLISVEPSPIYYLSPWLGDPHRPFTIVTEHRHRRFSTVPNPATHIQAILRKGFRLADIEDLYPSEHLDLKEDRGVIFAREFPLWTLLEFLKVKA